MSTENNLVWKVSRLESDIGRLDRRLDEQRRVIDVMDARNQDLFRLIEALERRLSDVERRNDDLEQQCENLRAEVRRGPSRRNP